MFNQFNAIHASLNEELADLRDKITSVETNDSRGSYFYADGSVALPVHKQDREMIAVRAAHNYDRISWESYLGNDGKVDQSKIMKVKGSKQTLAAFADMMTTKDNIGRFYGMILSYGDKKINPLHPVIAMMIAAGEIVLPEEFTIIVYPYLHRVEVDMSKVDEYSKELVVMISEIRADQYIPDISYAPSNNLRNDIQSLLTNENHVVRFRESGVRVVTAVIPVHLATKQIVFPYYGLIRSHSGSGGSSYYSGNLFPCLSGNIDTRGQDGGQTCVGELNNAAFSSLYVLSNMNIDSMYFGDVYTIESDNFIQSCQSVSAAFLLAAAGMTATEEEAEEPTESPVEDEASNEYAEESCESCSE